MKSVSLSRRAVEHELALAYHDLGAAAFALFHHGALQDPRLATRVRRVYELSNLRPAGYAVAGTLDSHAGRPPTRSATCT
jgi:hypothetical protein